MRIVRTTTKVRDVLSVGTPFTPLKAVRENATTNIKSVSKSIVAMNALIAVMSDATMNTKTVLKGIVAMNVLTAAKIMGSVKIIVSENVLDIVRNALIVSKRTAIGSVLVISRTIPSETVVTTSKEEAALETTPTALKRKIVSTNARTTSKKTGAGNVPVTLMTASKTSASGMATAVSKRIVSGNVPAIQKEIGSVNVLDALKRIKTFLTGTASVGRGALATIAPNTLDVIENASKRMWKSLSLHFATRPITVRRIESSMKMIGIVAAGLPGIVVSSASMKAGNILKMIEKTARRIGFGTNAHPVTDQGATKIVVRSLGTILSIIAPDALRKTDALKNVLSITARSALKRIDAAKEAHF